MRIELNLEVNQICYGPYQIGCVPRSNELVGFADAGNCFVNSTVRRKSCVAGDGIVRALKQSDAFRARQLSIASGP
jgi:hypothetical protein